MERGSTLYVLTVIILDTLTPNKQRHHWVLTSWTNGRLPFSDRFQMTHGGGNNTGRGVKHRDRGGTKSTGKSGVTVRRDQEEVSEEEDWDGVFSCEKYSRV